MNSVLPPELAKNILLTTFPTNKLRHKRRDSALAPEHPLERKRGESEEFLPETEFLDAYVCIFIFAHISNNGIEKCVSTLAPIVQRRMCTDRLCMSVRNHHRR